MGSDPSLTGDLASHSCVLIAANPFSGYGPSRARVRELAECLRSEGLQPRVTWENAERAALLADPNLDHWCCCVVAAGGDGTVAQVINENSAQLPLAVLPIGNENLFARQFGFAANIPSVARAIALGKTRQVDVARGDRRLFSLMLGVGFDADVVHRVARWRGGNGPLKRIRRASYLKPIVESLRRYSYDSIELEADGVRIRGTHALVFNLPQYAFQLPFAPEARGDDGWLDWVVFREPGLLHLVGYFSAVVRSRHLERADVAHGRARQLRIEAATAVPVQMDGEPAGFTPMQVEVLPLAIKVVLS